jgi:hypothetical protein
MKAIISLSVMMISCVLAFGQNRFSESITINETKNRLFKLASPDMEGRGTGQPGQRKAAEYIAFEFGKIGLLPLIGSPENKYFQRFLYNSTDSTENVLGYIPAKKPSSEWIVLTAHYDHLGKTGEKIYCGADDNASGTTGIGNCRGMQLSQTKRNGFQQKYLVYRFFSRRVGFARIQAVCFFPSWRYLKYSLKHQLGHDREKHSLRICGNLCWDGK